jgi:hypothetical protein
MIYDVAGRRVYLKTNVDSQELKVVDLVSSQQVLLVKVVYRMENLRKGDLLGLHIITKKKSHVHEWDFFNR